VRCLKTALVSGTAIGVFAIGAVRSATKPKEAASGEGFNWALLILRIAEIKS
jgi:hypothetical protein